MLVPLFVCPAIFVAAKHDQSKKEIVKCAFHEVCETMLSQLRNLAEYHYSYNKVDKEIHKVIRILENIFFKE